MFELLQDYVVTPAQNLAYQSAVQAGALLLGKRIGTTVVGEEPAIEDESALVGSFVDRVKKLPDQIRLYAEGEALSTGVACANKGLNWLFGISNPVAKLATEVALPAVVKYERQEGGQSKAVLRNAASHVCGTIAKEAVDNAVPQLAPYGGLVAYGLTAGFSNQAISSAFASTSGESSPAPGVPETKGPRKKLTSC